MQNNHFMGTEFVWFQGVVEDRNDPLKLGRCRVRCLGWHTEDKAKLPTELLPWAHPMLPVTSASMNGVGEAPVGPVEGTWVMGFFRDGMDAQKPVYIGTFGGIPSQAADPSKGFNDPNGNFPREIGQPDTNRLARTEDISATIVATKNKDRSKDIQSADNSWSEPLSSYNSRYPLNRVFESESGHVIEIDDSPESERIHIYHRAGTYIEIDRNGTVVQRVKGEKYEIVDHNGHLYIKGACRATVDGDVELQVNNAARIQVYGDASITARNDVDLSVSGDFNLSADNINMKGRTVKIEGDSFDVSTPSAKIDNLQSNNPILAQLPVVGPAASKTGLSDPDSEATTTQPSLPGLLTISRAEITAIENDDMGTGLTDSERQSLVDEGWADQVTDDFSTDDENTPDTNDKEATFKDCIELDNAKSIPESYQLSDNFTIGNLTTRTAVCRYPLRANAGLSKGQIACNLQHVAINVLEPILASHPNMIVTCGLRTKGGISFHERGLAADIQFTDLKTREQYFTVAKQLAASIVFDKLLLEYKTWGNRLPWIHIQIKGPHGYTGTNRKQVFTFNNHKNVASGRLLLLS